MLRPWPRLISLCWWLLAIGYVAVSALSLWGRLGPSRIGISAIPREDGVMVIDRVHPGGAAWEVGVQPGDILVSVDGAPVTISEWVSRRDAGVQFTVRSTATNQIITGSTREEPNDPGIFSPALSGSLFFGGLVFALTSFFVFSRASRKPEIITLSFLLIIAAWALTIAPAAGQWLWWASTIEVASVTWAAALFLSFFYKFPSNKEGPMPHSRYIDFMILLTPVAVLGMWMISITYFPQTFNATRQMFFAVVVAYSWPVWHSCSGLILRQAHQLYASN